MAETFRFNLDELNGHFRIEVFTVVIMHLLVHLMI